LVEWFCYGIRGVMGYLRYGLREVQLYLRVYPFT